MSIGMSRMSLSDAKMSKGADSKGGSGSMDNSQEALRWRTLNVQGGVERDGAEGSWLGVPCTRMKSLSVLHFGAGASQSHVPTDGAESGPIGGLTAATKTNFVGGQNAWHSHLPQM